MSIEEHVFLQNSYAYPIEYCPTFFISKNTPMIVK